MLKRPSLAERARLATHALRSVRIRDLPTLALDPVSASVLFQIAFLVSAVLGVVRQMLFSAQFGVGPEASAYVAAFRLPETLLNLVGGGALSSAMVPVLLRTRQAEGEAREREVVSRALTLIGAFGIASSVVGIALAGPFVRMLLAPGFDPATSALTVALARVMMLQPPLIIVTTVAMAVLASRSQFFLAAVSVALHNIALIGGIVAAHAFPQIGIAGPVAGLLADGVLQAAILLPGLRANGLRFRLSWSPSDPRLRQIVRLLIPSGLSAIVNYSGTIVDTAAASFVRQPGALPAVNSALLLIGLPIRLLGQAVSQAVFPRLAATAAAHEWQPMRRLYLRAMGGAVGMAIPAAVALVVAGRWLVGLLFERGAFDSAAADLTYQALVAYALGLPFYIATELSARALAALYDTRTPLLTNLLQVAGRIGMLAALLGPLGAVAIPLAFAATSAVESMLLTTVFWLRLRRRSAGISRHALAD